MCKTSANYYSLAIFLSFILLIKEAYGQINYIVNGNFQTYPLSTNVAYFVNQTNQMSPWTGYFQLKGSNYGNPLGYGQYIDLQQEENGNISQIITLPQNGRYNFSFYQKAYDGNFSSYQMEIYWNSQFIQSFSPTTLALTQEWIQVSGIVGQNILYLKEVGTLLNNQSTQQFWVGTQIDQLSLTLIQVQNSTQTAQSQNITQTAQPQNITQTAQLQNITQIQNTTQIQEVVKKDEVQQNKKNSEQNGQQNGFQIFGSIFGGIMNLPLNQIPVLKYLIILIDDFWLYAYDKHNYKGIVRDIFDTIIIMQNQKWNILAKIVPLEEFVQMIPISDYSKFSRQRILQNQGNDQNLIKSLMSYFIFSVPQSILICLMLYALFNLLFNNQISIILRRYSFLLCCILQVLLQNNLPYFTFTSFCQFQLFFSFNFYDKLSMVIGTLFFLACLIFGIGFYTVLVSSYKKQSCYFIYCFYRCKQTYYYLTFKILIRGLLKGAIHFFLNSWYVIEMKALISVEIMVIALTIILQKKYEIFISKTFMCLFILYHFFFILIDVSFILESYIDTIEDNSSLLVVSGQIQYFLVYCILCTTICIMVIDFIPLNKLKFKDTFHEQLDNNNYQIVLPSNIKSDNVESDNNNSKKQQKASNLLNQNNGKIQKKQRKEKIYKADQKPRKIKTKNKKPQKNPSNLKKDTDLLIINKQQQIYHRYKYT